MKSSKWSMTFHLLAYEHDTELTFVWHPREEKNQVLADHFSKVSWTNWPSSEGVHFT